VIQDVNTQVIEIIKKSPLTRRNHWGDNRPMEHSHITALERAAEHCGGLTKLAIALGVGQPVVSNWKARGTILDAVYCTAIERVTDGVVTRRDLRPNDWQAIWPELAAA
jgi:DNA-binding transcriptional regulator YdaS (Cro superfamily)